MHTQICVYSADPIPTIPQAAAVSCSIQCPRGMPMNVTSPVLPSLFDMCVLSLLTSSSTRPFKQHRMRQQSYTACITGRYQFLSFLPPSHHAHIAPLPKAQTPRNFVIRRLQRSHAASLGPCVCRSLSFARQPLTMSSWPPLTPSWV